jgi:hypothetical protein
MSFCFPALPRKKTSAPCDFARAQSDPLIFHRKNPPRSTLPPSTLHVPPLHSPTPPPLARPPHARRIPAHSVAVISTATLAHRSAFRLVSSHGPLTTVHRPRTTDHGPPTKPSAQSPCAQPTSNRPCPQTPDPWPLPTLLSCFPVFLMKKNAIPREAQKLPTFWNGFQLAFAIGDQPATTADFLRTAAKTRPLASAKRYPHYGAKTPAPPRPVRRNPRLSIPDPPRYFPIENSTVLSATLVLCTSSIVSLSL